MPEKPFVVLKGYPEGFSIEHPHYFRGRFQTHAEAVLRCEQILASGFARLEVVVRDAGLSHHDLATLLFVYFSFPCIYHKHAGYDYELYSSIDSYHRHTAMLERKLRVPCFHRGERVRYTGSRESPFWLHAGNVTGSEFLDNGIYPDEPTIEPISVRLDSDGLVHIFTANQLYLQSDHTNEAHSRERWKLIQHLATEFQLHTNAA